MKFEQRTTRRRPRSAGGSCRTQKRKRTRHGGEASGTQTRKNRRRGEGVPARGEKGVLHPDRGGSGRRHRRVVVPRRTEQEKGGDRDQSEPSPRDLSRVRDRKAQC